MRAKFFVVSLLVVLLMYAVPFTVLNRVEGAYTAAFWAGLSGAYLLFVWAMLRRD